MTYTIEVAGLTKSYGNVRALDGLDLAVAPGSVYGLLGPNGAGKTTLVRILTTLVRPDAGTAYVAGHDLRSQGSAVRGRRADRQYAAVDDLLTGRENLVMMAGCASCPPPTPAAAAPSCWPSSTSRTPPTAGLGPTPAG